MTDSSNSRYLSFYERSQCIANVTLLDMPQDASGDFKIAGQFDAVGTVSAVAFLAKANAEGMRVGGATVIFFITFLLL